MTTQPANPATPDPHSETPDKPRGTLRGLLIVAVTLVACALLYRALPFDEAARKGLVPTPSSSSSSAASRWPRRSARSNSTARSRSGSCPWRARTWVLRR